MRNATPRRYGLKTARIVSFERNPAEVPKITKIAGPIQHEVASNEASMVPTLDRFSFFTNASPCGFPNGRFPGYLSFPP